ncbi:MAG: substrate-binding domain-containing protein, partial [Burkholderiales bacterium]|nr:substrate-binding domain-containing protein [Burkholderiales bacterium]
RVAVAGFDDIEIARLVTPALTTIRVPRLRIGQVAADMMLARLAGGAPRMRIVDTGFELIVRDSA